MFGTRKLKAETAEEINEVQTPNGIRKRIMEHSRYDPLIRHVLDAAMMQGWSGEDMYAFLAYHALVAKQQLESELFDYMNSRAPEPIRIKQD